MMYNDNNISIEFIDMAIIMSKKSYKFSLENYNILILYLMIYHEYYNEKSLLHLAKYVKDTYKKTNDIDIGLKNIMMFFKSLRYCGVINKDNSITDYINYITIDDVINMVYEKKDIKMYLRLKKLKEIMK